MKRPVLFILLSSALLALNESRTDAQLWKMKRIELMAGAGPSFFFGDIGGYSNTSNMHGVRDISLQNARANLNLSGRYRLKEDLNLRLSLTAGALKASDNQGSNELRAIESTITIFEPAVLGEFDFIKNKAENSYLYSRGKKSSIKKLIQIMDFYAFTGIGGLNYSVKGNQNLEAEGYKKGGFTAVIPAGFGMSVIYSSDISLGMEIGGRYSFSDYLDGYSSQYSNSKDVYYFLNFCFTYKLKTGTKKPAIRR